ncbi:MAG: molybdopterin-binding protein [Armatimonadota bacterium]|nr:molybdopterin-binding protein [Armatimonadota bacterium]
MGATVEIVAVGNELLDGLTQDTNTHWLCRQISGLGSWVRRAVLVRDDVEAIATEVLAARGRATALLLVTGGLGPTADDVTLEGLARAADRPLVEHPIAREMVARRYAELHRRGLLASPELSRQRLKMAVLPEGAEPIENPVGAAPAVLLRLEPTTIVCLPGVPTELKGIFTEQLPPVLTSILGAGVLAERDVLVRLNDESAMAGAIAEVAALFPDIYVKSHARRFEQEGGIRVTLSARGTQRAAVEALLDQAEEAVRARLPVEDAAHGR